MKSLIKTIFSVLFLCAALSAYGDDIVESALLWMVDDDLVTEVTGQVAPVPVSELRSRPDGLEVNYARVLAVKTDGTGDTVFLNLFTPDGEGGIRNAGTLTIVSNGKAGPLWANVTGYEDPTWSFMIELGNFNYSSDGERVLTQMAYSAKATYEDLKRFIQAGETLDPPMTPWTGGSYVVPEPTSGLLVLVGGALLALRRRRREGNV